MIIYVPEHEHSENQVIFLGCHSENREHDGKIIIGWRCKRMPVGPRGKWAIKRPSITKTRETTYAQL